MTAPLYVWYRGAFVALRINADTQEEKKKFIYHKNGGKRMEDYRNKTKKVQIGNVYDEHENRRRGSLCGADLKA